MQQDAYSSTQLAKAANVSRQAICKRANREGWSARKRQGRGGGKEFLFSDLPKDIKAVVATNQAINSTPSPLQAGGRIGVPLDQNRKTKAAAKLDLINLYLEWMGRNGKSIESRESFITSYKAGTWSHLLDTIGPKVSWKSIERWKKQINDNKDLSVIADKRGIARKGMRQLDDIQKNALIRFLLTPGEPTIAAAYREANKALVFEGQEKIGSQSLAYRFIKEDFLPYHFGEWTYVRKGAKAWNDQCSFFIERDYSLIEVGDIIVADGHKLNFEVVNPWTGKAQRMELILWYDMKSNMPLGWEIMPSEDTQAIASALRRACMALGKYPKVAYLDNGRAFRSKFFNGSDLRQSGVGGLFYSLGIQTLFAWPYHGQSKTVERFFGTFAELERWLPSYSGTSIDKKPPRMMRGERMHRKIYENSGGRPLTLSEAHYAVGMFFDEYIQRPQKGHLKGQCPAEVFIDGRGEGLIPEQLEQLRELMLHKEIRHIGRNGIKLFGNNYYNAKLYSRRHSVVVKYDPQACDESEQISHVLVYDHMGNFIARADRVQGVHPAARILGEDCHRQDLKAAIELKKTQEKGAANIARTMLENVVMPETQAKLKVISINNKTAALPSAPEIQPVVPSKELEAARDRAKAEQASSPAYTPPQDRHDILTPYHRYDYLLRLAEQDGVTLTEEDQQWMGTYEQTNEYRTISHQRFDMLREFYARQRNHAAEA
ncbi:Mu transposase C-terminal domain-containing protein [uncultured Pseudodesulfovibrio sp.]|uniref:Mu transposase C-terminal domain-containing protein n=1 Tax=uncultured Pseudodesulfovibrio sp. TaxID=2035858 RepID=UPI0029C904A9|nr:Mu transposase C-terminal domain-containing protein [uncultured Pseudodesulfovibrio sp.]